MYDKCVQSYMGHIGSIYLAGGEIHRIHIETRVSIEPIYAIVPVGLTVVKFNLHIRHSERLMTIKLKYKNELL